MKKKLFILLILIILGCGGYYAYNKVIPNEVKVPELVPELEKVNVTEYYIYSTNMNMKGNLSIDNLNYKDIKLIFYNDNFVEKELNVNKIDNGLEFYISKEINSGVYLDNIDIGKYNMFIKITYEGLEENVEERKDVIKYYSLDNQTDYKETTYYTMLKYNKKIVINSNNKYSTMMFNITQNNDENIYDIVIDPGHGGMDGGAAANGYSERDFTLNIAKQLKEELEKIGLKIKLTREEGMFTSNQIMPTYGTHGRAVIAGEVKAKYLFSIHMNSNGYSNISGLEIYTPNNINYDFAKVLAQNLTSYTGLSYSPNRTNKIYNGIYTRTFTEYDINNSKKDNIAEGLLPYDITTNSNYYYIIRETGGYMTGAYVDGRDPSKGENPFYKSNTGTESYILELGYISNKNDVDRIINQRQKYIDAVVDSIKNELNM